jgi:hypothetical protein
MNSTFSCFSLLLVIYRTTYLPHDFAHSSRDLPLRISIASLSTHLLPLESDHPNKEVDTRLTSLDERPCQFVTFWERGGTSS